jgi:hypothetical protein
VEIVGRIAHLVNNNLRIKGKINLVIVTKMKIVSKEVIKMQLKRIQWQQMQPSGHYQDLTSLRVV